MKLTDTIEVNGIKKIVICGSVYQRSYSREQFRRYVASDIEKFDAEQMARRIRDLIQTGRWRCWVHGDTINMVMLESR